MVTDPIADMLTRIRNGQKAGHAEVQVPASKMKLEIAKIFKAEGFIKNFKLVQDNKQGLLKVFLKQGEKKEIFIHDLSRVSKPGRRVYATVDEIPKVKGGMGICVLSTSKGIMTDKRARQEKVGGEVVCTIW
jgi:small subunit ribosomal protein S8